MQPDLQNLPSFYKGYVEHVKDHDMLDALRLSSNKVLALIENVPEEKGHYRYQPEKWSIKEVLCHLMDVERIMCYRALRFARNDKTPLAGFEENDYAPEANADARSVARLIKEMKQLRVSTVDLFSSFSTNMLQRSGTANNVVLSVLNLGYIIAGHESHHHQVLVERYLKNL